MRRQLLSAYEQIVIKRPILALVLVLLAIAFFAYFAREFKLDASADSLVLENDRDLRYYRSIRARYGSDNFLIITFSPHIDLFSEKSLADLRSLRTKLQQIDRVEKVVSILDVPLIDSPRVSLAEIQKHVRTLDQPDTIPELARAEFLTSPLYQNLILSPDGKTTALQVIFRRDETYFSLLGKRNALREKTAHRNAFLAGSTGT